MRAVGDGSQSSLAWKWLRWPFLVFLLIWAALTTNAWKYFSESGVYGAYLSAMYSVEVLSLPIDKMPEQLDSRSALSRRELIALTESPPLRFDHNSRRELRSTWDFSGPNLVYRSSSFGNGVSRQELTYFLDENRICFFEAAPYGLRCEKFYRDPDGRLFKYFAGARGIPAGWITAEIKESNRK